MTLDEAIIHLDESLADSDKWQGCQACKDEHFQLYEWLVELREWRAGERKLGQNAIIS